MAELRRVERLVSGNWVECLFEELVVGDVFRMFEPGTGALVDGDEACRVIRAPYQWVNEKGNRVLAVKCERNIDQHVTESGGCPEGERMNNYMAHVRISGTDPDKDTAMYAAVKELDENWKWQWDYEDNDDDIVARGTGSTTDVRDFATRLTQSIWEANGGFCAVTVKMMLMVLSPYEEHRLDEAAYAAWKEKECPTPS